MPTDLSEETQKREYEKRKKSNSISRLLTLEKAITIKSRTSMALVYEFQL